MSIFAEDTPSSELEYRSVVGRETFGIVRKAKFQEHIVAVKQFPRIWREMQVLKRISHENIVKLIGFVEGAEVVEIVIEFVECGNLYDLLHRDLSINYSLSHALNYFSKS